RTADERGVPAQRQDLIGVLRRDLRQAALRQRQEDVSADAVRVRVDDVTVGREAVEVGGTVRCVHFELLLGKGGTCRWTQPSWELQLPARRFWAQVARPTR